MIYFLHIKNTENLDCKLFFKTSEDLESYFRNCIPTKVVREVEDKRFKEGSYEYEHYTYKETISGTILRSYLEVCIDIQIIDEVKCNQFESLFKGKFYEGSLLSTNTFYDGSLSSTSN